MTDPEEFAKLKAQIGCIMFNMLSMSKDGKAIEANPATHRIADMVYSRVTKLSKEVNTYRAALEECAATEMSQIAATALNKYPGKTRAESKD